MQLTKSTRSLLLLFSTLAACEQHATSSSPVSTTAAPVVAGTSRDAKLKTLAAGEDGFVSAVDERGVPHFIWALGSHPAEPADTAQTAAERHFAKFSGAMALSRTDLESKETRFVRPLRGGGVLARFGQRLNGVEVYPATVNVLMKDNLELVAIAGAMRPALPPKSGFALSPKDAFTAALAYHFDHPEVVDQVIDLAERRNNFEHFVLSESSQLHLPQPGRSKPIFYAAPDSDALRPAYFVEFFAGWRSLSTSDAFRYIIAADDGTILRQHNLTASDTFTYRAYGSSTDLRPFDGPLGDLTPHPTGLPDGTSAGPIPSELVVVDGFNLSPSGTFDSWLPAAAVETVGNNVDAYADDNDPDGYSNGDIRALTTGVRTFDYAYDHALEPNQTEAQRMAGITNLFYVNNWLHDYWYDSGFDEVAGNAQYDNYGRGGFGGDRLKAENQDGHDLGRRNNANMSTPADGLQPRMQMFTWTGVETTHVTLNAGGTISELAAGTASFGPLEFDVTGPVVLATDGVGVSSNDGCEPISNVAGRIALIDRGSCNFTVKVVNAQAGGAIGVIIADNRVAAVPPGMGGTDPTVAIGVLSVYQADGNAIKTALLAGAVTATLYRQMSVEREGGFDNAIIAHEWGHYFHHRLQDCTSDQCRAQSEGWGDCVAMHMVLRQGDSLDGVFGTAIYATASDPNSAYYGIRRYPYSTDVTKNGLSFRHIMEGVTMPPNGLDFGSHGEVHNAGEVWCSMLFEAYVDMQRRAATSTTTSFEEVRRTMANYYVAGLQMTPVDATFTETRDGLLAVAAAQNPVDHQTMATAFARRGAGSCAESPPRYAAEFAFTDVVESNELKSRIQIGNVSFSDDLRSCDGHDGTLDADERGTLSIEVANGGALELLAAHLTLTTTSAGVLFPGGAVVDIASIPPYGSTTVQVEIAVDPALTDLSTMVIGMRLTDEESCEVTTTSTVVSRINLDTQSGSTFDDAESAREVWARTGPLADQIWSREPVFPLDHAYYGIDYGAVSDTSLESPPLDVGATDFIIEFDHRYSFEADTVFWDGGVIEITTNGGANWTDIATYLDPGYGGALTDISGNPLALRNAFVATNASYPARDRLVLNLGTMFANQTVQFRFRIGTDGGVGAFGWEIDNINVTGILNGPFDRLVPDAFDCPIPLIADAGPDQNVSYGVLVAIDATGSISSENLPLTYSWAQLAGPAVTMFDPSAGRTVFASPSLETESTLTFQVTVGDGVRTATDTVDIFVAAAPAPVLTANAGEDLTVDHDVTVVLDGSNSATSGTLPLSYVWTQVSGTAVTLSNATGAVARFVAPRVPADETLTFQLAVTDGPHNATDTIDVLVHAYVEPTVTAVAGADQSVDPGALVVLDGSGSTSDAGLPLTFTWTQIDGPQVTLTGASGPAARFTAPTAAVSATLTFELTVSDGTRTATDQVEVAVAGATLTASAGPDVTVDGGETVLLDASASASSLGRALTFSWRQTSGPTIDIQNSNGATAVIVAPVVEETDAAYTFEVTVSDGVNMATDSVTVTVSAIATPTLTAVAGMDREVYAGAGVVLDASDSSSSADLPLTFDWAQTMGSMVMLSATNKSIVSFTAPSVTMNTVLSFEVTVSDGTRTAKDAVAITVRPSPVTPPAMTDDSSCNCSAAPRSDTTGSVIGTVLFAAVALVLRRRRR